MPALGCIVAGDLKPLEPRRPERERLANLRHHPAPDRGGQASQQLRILNRVVPPPLRFRIEPVSAPLLAGPLDAGLDTPPRLQHVDQPRAGLEVERPRDEQHRRLTRHLDRPLARVPGRRPAELIGRRALERADAEHPQVRIEKHEPGALVAFTQEHRLHRALAVDQHRECPLAVPSP